jgi:NAD(P)-dependent dehydrogenase (short-subunit alcohol dehydrogenase family)
VLTNIVSGPKVGPKGICVNSISPSPVSTALWLGDSGVAQNIAAATGSDPKAVAEQAVASTATKRFTTSEEIADLVLFSLATARPTSPVKTSLSTVASPNHCDY